MMDTLVWKVWLLYFVVSIVVTTYGSELFTSIDKLRDLSTAEDQVISDIYNLVDTVDKRIKKLESLVEDIKENKMLIPEYRTVPANPVEAYLLIKRWYSISKMFTNTEESHKDEDDVVVDDAGSISFSCKDNNHDCDYWAKIGECEKNPLYMEDQCKLSCKICRRPVAVNNDEKVFQAMLYRLLQLSDTAVPTPQDYEGTIESIVRLQRTYSLNTSDIVRGNVGGSISTKGLTAEDCYHIGKKAYGMDEWGYSVQWLKEALNLDEDGSLAYDIQIKLIQAYIKMGDYLRANSTLFLLDERSGTDLELEVSNTISSLKGEIKYSEFSGSKLSTQIEPNALRQAPNQWVDVYEELCRGEGIESSPTAVCRYRPAGLPWNCYKEEILRMNPRISMVYDVITDEENDMLKGKAKDKMSRGVVGPSGEPSTTRISNVGWLDDDEDPFVKYLSERVSLITGLEVTLTSPYDDDMSRISADSFQAVNYGTGGHYVPHVDYFTGDRYLAGTRTEKIMELSGDRIATFLIYLTDVKAGGSTVYPKVKVQVPPIKNAAAFWFNSRLSGEYDPLTLHAGCPVLLGEKWVCNKWVREYGNEFKRKCGLTEDAGYT